MQDLYDPRNLLLEGRRKVLNELVSLASERAKAEILLESFYRIEEKLGNMAPAQKPLKYAAFRRTLWAVKKLLEDRDRPIRVSQMVRELIEGGLFSADPDGIEGRIKQALGQAGNKNKLIELLEPVYGGAKNTLQDGWVVLHSWSEAKRALRPED